MGDKFTFDDLLLSIEIFNFGFEGPKFYKIELLIQAYHLKYD